MVLQTTNSVHIAWYAAEPTGRMAAGCCRKRVCRIENDVNRPLTHCDATPSVPLYMLQLSGNLGLRQYPRFEFTRPCEPSNRL